MSSCSSWCASRVSPPELSSACDIARSAAPLEGEEAFQEFVRSRSLTYGYPHTGQSMEELRQKEFSRLSSLSSCPSPSRFPITYLDHAASALYTESQLRAHYEDLRAHTFANPHSNSPCSVRTTARIEAIRARILRFFGVSSLVECCC
jgi:hypothetical protein